MKRLFFSLAVVGMFAASAAAQAIEGVELGEMRDGVEQDVQELRTDTDQVKQDRAEVRRARDGYVEAVRRFGENSPQAEAATQRLMNAQLMLRQDQAVPGIERRDPLQDRAFIDRNVLVGPPDKRELQESLDEDLQSGESETTEIGKYRAAVRSAHDDLQNAVKLYGVNSPQSVQSEETLFEAQRELHRALHRALSNSRQ